MPRGLSPGVRRQNERGSENGPAARGLVRVVDGIVADFCKRRGLNPAIGVKGGQAEIAHSLIGLVLVDKAEEILAAAGAPKPIAVADSDAA